MTTLSGLAIPALGIAAAGGSGVLLSEAFLSAAKRVELFMTMGVLFWMSLSPLLNWRDALCGKSSSNSSTYLKKGEFF